VIAENTAARIASASPQGEVVAFALESEHTWDPKNAEACIISFHFISFHFISFQFPLRDFFLRGESESGLKSINFWTLIFRFHFEA
jgi:sigma54-dependent transcription regulator